MTKFTKIILYARFSHPGQAQGTSLERQFGKLEAFCAREGLTVTDRFSDDGRSGYHGHHRSRGHFGEFEAEALQGEHHGALLLVENLDRLSRQGHEETQDLIRSLTRNGVSVWTLERDRYDAGKPITLEQVIMGACRAQRAWDEAETKANRSRDNHRIKMAKAVENGKALSKRTWPWLFVNDAGQYERHPDRAAIAERIFRMADQPMGAQTIVKMLNGEGVPYWGGQPCWPRNRVVELLSNRAVIGEKVDKDGTVHANFFPPIVPVDLFERVQAGAQDRKANRGGAKSPVVANLLSGLCRCAECDARMVYVGSGALRCHTSLNGGDCQNKVPIPYQRLERTLVESALHLALDDTHFVRTGEVARLNVLTAERDRALKAATDKAEKLWLASVGEDASPMAEKLARKAEAEASELTANLVALRGQLETAKGRVDSAEHLRRVEDMKADLESRDEAVRIPVRRKVAQAFRALFKLVQCDRDGVRIFLHADAALILIDRKGNLVHGFDMVKEGRDVPVKIKDYVRRREAAVADGGLFKRRVEAA